MRRKDSLWN